MQKLITKAASTPKGIRFYSQKDSKMISFSTPVDGKVTAKWISSKSEEYITQTYNEYPKYTTLTITLLYICMIISFLDFVNYLVFKHNITGIRISVSALLFFSLFKFFFLNLFLGKKTDGLKFHSAEHMAINAVNTLGRIPTMEELKTFSRYSNYCSVNSDTSTIVRYTIILVCSFVPFIPINWIFYLIVMILCSSLESTGIFNFMQYFATENPEDIHLQTALEGIKVWAEHELTENNETLSKQETAYND